MVPLISGEDGQNGRMASFRNLPGGKSTINVDVTV